MQLFFGFVGLFNILACWPIGIVLHFTGVERFEVPSAGRIVVGLLINVSCLKFRFLAEYLISMSQMIR